MLSLFPQLLFLAPLGYTLLRIAVAMFLILGIRAQFLRDRSTGMFVVMACEALVTLGLAIGALTQLAALVAIGVFAAWLFVPTIRPYARSTAYLLIVISLVLLLGGAGAFAFDLPL